MKPADPLDWLRAIIPDADLEDRAALEAFAGEAMVLAAIDANAAGVEGEGITAVRLAIADALATAAAAMEGMPRAREALATAAATLHGRAVEQQANRAAAWSTAAVLAALEGYRDVRELAESEYLRNAESRAVLAALVAATTVDGAPDPLADVALADAGKRGQYAGELLGWGRRVAQLFEGEPPATEDEARATVDTPKHGPALRWDAGFADLLDTVGPVGRDLADDVREGAAKRTAAARSDNPPPAGQLWLLWAELELVRGSPPRWLRLLAKALWADVWRRALVRERRPVALAVTGLLGVVRGALAGVAVQPGADGRAVLVDREGRALSRFEVPRLTTAVQAEALEALALAGVRELRTVAAVRFVPWFAHAVQRRPDETAALTFEGIDGVNAYGAVAAAMGMDPSKHADDVRGLLHALSCAILSYPNGDEASVLMLAYRKGGGRGNPSRLTLTPGRPWLAGDVFELPEGSAYRALAPIPMLPDHAPPFVGNRQDRGALARLYLRILAELAHESPDIYRGLGAHIPGARWAELANAEGLRNPGPLALDAVKARWARDGDDGPAVFERMKGAPDRWHLAPAFVAEREMLEAGGKQRIGASIGGKLSTKAKAEARGRLADGKRKKGRR